MLISSYICVFVDVYLQPDPLPSVTYRVIGGVLDFHFIISDNPESVTRHYTSVSLILILINRLTSRGKRLLVPSLLTVHFMVKTFYWILCLMSCLCIYTQMINYYNIA